MKTTRKRYKARNGKVKGQKKLSFLCPESVSKKLNKIAFDNELSLSNLICLISENFIKEKRGALQV